MQRVHLCPSFMMFYNRNITQGDGEVLSKYYKHELIGVLISGVLYKIFAWSPHSEQLTKLTEEYARTMVKLYIQ